MNPFARPIVCVDIRGAAVSVIGVARGRVKRWARLAASADPVSAANADVAADLGADIRALLGTWGFQRATGWMTIADDSLVMRRVQLPPMRRGELERAIGYAIDRELPFPATHSARGWAVIGRESAHREVLLAGGWSDVVERTIAVGRSAGLTVQRVEPRSVCLARALHGANAIVVEAADGVLQALHVGSLPAVTATVPVAADGAQVTAAVEGVVRMVAARLALRPAEESSRVVAIGELEALTSSVGFPAEPATRLLNGSGPKRPDDFPAADYMAALGLAMGRAR